MDNWRRANGTIYSYPQFERDAEVERSQMYAKGILNYQDNVVPTYGTYEFKDLHCVRIICYLGLNAWHEPILLISRLWTTFVLVLNHLLFYLGQSLYFNNKFRSSKAIDYHQSRCWKVCNFSKPGITRSHVAIHMDPVCDVGINPQNPFFASTGLSQNEIDIGENQFRLSLRSVWDLPIESERQLTGYSNKTVAHNAMSVFGKWWGYASRVQAFYHSVLHFLQASDLLLQFNPEVKPLTRKKLI